MSIYKTYLYNSTMNWTILNIYFIYNHIMSQALCLMEYCQFNFRWVCSSLVIQFLGLVELLERSMAQWRTKWFQGDACGGSPSPKYIMSLDNGRFWEMFNGNRIGSELIRTCIQTFVHSLFEVKIYGQVWYKFCYHRCS